MLINPRAGAVKKILFQNIQKKNQKKSKSSMSREPEKAT